MTFPACAGVTSPVSNPMPLRLCQGCALYVFGADGLKPAARRAGGESWACTNHQTSLPASQALAGPGTETGAGSFFGEG